MRHLILALFALALLPSWAAAASQNSLEPEDADPILACYQVVDVADDDVLNMRQGPHYTTDKVGEIPPHARCVADLDEFTYVGSSMWKKVAYGGIEGWVNARYLAPVEDCASWETAPQAHPADQGRAAMRESGVESISWITSNLYAAHMAGLHHELRGELVRGSDPAAVCSQLIFQEIMRAADDQHKSSPQVYFRVWDFRIVGVDGVCVLPGYEASVGAIYD